MPNEEVLGPRKTMFVLVIVVGCFAVLWPKILSPLLLGGSRDQLKPNAYDREAGCCEVIFESEVAILEILNEVCYSIVNADGKLSPYAAAECRRAVNDTCGVDIAAFLKRTDNVGKTSKKLLDTMKASNSSCLKEHFGLPAVSTSIHPALNSWVLKQDANLLKQERSPMRGPGAHPALRERGRAIPAATVPPRPPTPLPPHHRVPYNNPLSGYFEIDIKPPPIPGMRPPLGAPGGPVPAPKSSMGLVMPIYTICIIVFFVYTLSKLLFRRGNVPYDPIAPNPQFRRRVFRDDSRSTPDRLGPKERDAIVTAISGLVAEVQQQMEASYAQNQQRQDPQDNHARPYSNGTVIHSGPVQIVASEYREPSVDKRKEKTPELSPEAKDSHVVKETPEVKETSEAKETSEVREATEKVEELIKEYKDIEQEKEREDTTPESQPVIDLEVNTEGNKIGPEDREVKKDAAEASSEEEVEIEEEEVEVSEEEEEESPKDPTEALIKLTEKIEQKTDTLAKLTGDFLDYEKDLKILSTSELEKKTTDLLEEALKESSPESSPEKDVEDGEQDNASVKVVGMETTAHTADGTVWPRAAPPPLTPLPPARPSHEAEEVKSIFLETEIPQQSRVLVSDFAQDREGKLKTKHSPDREGKLKTKHSPLVVSGKMTLSLIQDGPRDTPERDPESTLDDFTTASGFTQPAEKDDDLSEEEEEEIEIEEIEEEYEEDEEEDEEPKEKK